MFRLKMFGFSSNKSTEPTNEKSWILDFVLGKNLNPKGQTVKHVTGPLDDGSVVKQVSDCSVFINAVFTQEAIDNYNFDDESCTPPEWDQAILIVKDYHLKFVPAPSSSDCEFLLVIGKFSLLDVHDGFYSKHTARDCMEDPQVQVAVGAKWTQWMAENKDEDANNEESQYTGTCQLSQLLEEIGQPDTQTHSQTQGSFQLNIHSDDKMSGPEAGPSKALPARGHLSEAVSARAPPGETMVSALARMKQTTPVADLIIPPEQLAILEALEEWKEDYHPQPSQDTTSSSDSSRPNFSQPTLAESPRKRDHTGACKSSGKTRDKSQLLKPQSPARTDMSKPSSTPESEAGHREQERGDVLSDETSITDRQIQPRPASFSHSVQEDADAECHQYSNKRADGQGTPRSKDVCILKPNSANTKPGYFSIKGISRFLNNNESPRDKRIPLAEVQGQSRITDTPEEQVGQNADSVHQYDRSPKGFTAEYMKFLDSSNKFKKGYRSDSSNKSKMVDKSDSSDKSKMVDKSDSSNKSKMADKSDSSDKSKMADQSDSSDKSKMADKSDSCNSDICVIDVVTLCSLPTAWHKSSADSVEFSCSLPEDSQNSQDSQISMSSQSCPSSQTSQSSQTGAPTDAEHGAGDTDMSRTSDLIADMQESTKALRNRSGKLSASSRLVSISEDCQSEIQARETEPAAGRGKGSHPDTRRVSFAPSAVMKYPSLDLDKVGSTQPFDVVNDSTYSMYEDAKSHLSTPDPLPRTTSHLDFPESQPFVPFSQDLLVSDSVEDKSRSNSDPCTQKDYTDVVCDSVEHLTDAHSTGYSETVINDTSFHHSTQTSGVTRKSTPDFLISPIRRVTRNSRVDSSDNGDKSGSDSVFDSALDLPKSQRTSVVVECVVLEGESQKHSTVDKAVSQRSALRSEESVEKTASQPKQKLFMHKSPSHDHPSFDESDSLERIPLSHGQCKGGNTGAVETVEGLCTPETDPETTTTKVLTRSKSKKNFTGSSHSRQSTSDPETSLGRNRRKPVHNLKENITEKLVRSPGLDKQNQSAKESDLDLSDKKSDSEIVIEEYSTDSDVSKVGTQDQSRKDSLKSGGTKDESASGGEDIRADVSITMDVDSGQKAGPSRTEGDVSMDDSVILVEDEDEEHAEEITEAAEPPSISGKELRSSNIGKRGSQKPSDNHPDSQGYHNILEKYITTRRTRSSKQDNNDADGVAPPKLRSSRAVVPGPEGDASSQAKISPKCTQNSVEKIGTRRHGTGKSVNDADKKTKKRSKLQHQEVPESQGQEEDQGPERGQVQNKVIEVDDAEKDPRKKKKKKEVEIMFEKAVKKYGLIGSVSKGWKSEKCYGKQQQSVSRANKKDEEEWSQVLCEADGATRCAGRQESRDGARKVHPPQVRESSPSGQLKDIHAGGAGRQESRDGARKVHQPQVRESSPGGQLKDIHTDDGTSQELAVDSDMHEITDQLDIENIPIHLERGTRELKQSKRTPAQPKRKQMKGIMPEPYCRDVPGPRQPSVGTWDEGRKAVCRRVSSIRRESGIDSSQDVPTTQVLLDFLEMQPPEHQPLLDLRVPPDLLHKICSIYRKPISYPH
ncbi:dentin sialophosphoprotein-like isoform X2 [Haliotis rufescens]|uniref:dentin sialophosphoprotein-like isoform X2 n=1 Tax=Haliotis rufescens TaxID=6454 RepID=UPI00201F0A9E|nr:dentin sialophosphoprotein-like isoform X2 [Haliotis rufescens]